MRNKLIVFEGIDGVGKTTLLRALQNELKKKKIPALLYENTEREYQGYNALKPFIKENASIDASLLFYLSSAIYKSQKIEKLLTKHWILCDRYAYSTLAYHVSRKSRLFRRLTFNDLCIRKPDYAFLITCEEKKRLQRARMRKVKKLIDSVPKRKGNKIDLMEKA